MREICVVDCSLGIGWLFDQQADDYTEATLQALTQSSAIAQRWWLVETLNVLLALERRERLSVGKAVEALRLLQRPPVQLRDTQTSIFELHALANRHRLTSYDALYLDMALSTGLPLATRDKALRQAATESGVGVWQA